MKSTAAAMAAAEEVDSAFSGLTVIDDASDQVKGVNKSQPI